jgi:zinc transport system substrate-binding protein
VSKIRKFLRLSGIAAFLSVVSPVVANAERKGAELKVVTTMKPVHALVAMVMGTTGSPKLIVDGATSPHTYALKPSDAAVVGNADVVFRMSERIEGFTNKLAKTLREPTQMVTLIDTPGLSLLPVRTGATFEKHADDKLGKSSGHGHSHHGSHGHDTGKDGKVNMDGHAWLDPDNASLMIDHIAAVLSAKDAANAPTYKANAASARTELVKLSQDIEALLAALASRPFVVFHDSTQYFERRYGLNAVGSISTNPEIPPSGKRLAALRKKIITLGPTCVFSEPNFEAKVVASVTEGSQAKSSMIDPEGAMLPAGRDHYAATLRKLADAHVSCLK